MTPCLLPHILSHCNNVTDLHRVDFYREMEESSAWISVFLTNEKSGGWSNNVGALSQRDTLTKFQFDQWGCPHEEKKWGKTQNKFNPKRNKNLNHWNLWSFAAFFGHINCGIGCAENGPFCNMVFTRDVLQKSGNHL